VAPESRRAGQPWNSPHAARSARRRAQQIDSLRAANQYVQQSRDDPSVWEVGLRLPNGVVVKVTT